MRPTPEAIAAVTEVLRHEDPRVRANAVESLARQSRLKSRAAPAVIIELKADDHHRVRANAIRAGIASAAAGPDALTPMLTDTRPMHRLAGVWLAGRAPGQRTPELIARLGELARFDADPRVRARAVACSQRFDAELRVTWRAANADA